MNIHCLHTGSSDKYGLKAYKRHVPGYNNSIILLEIYVCINYEFDFNSTFP